LRSRLPLESADMAVYYFDLRDGDGLVVDKEGLELRDIDAAQTRPRGH
jgi:hypothetical protein